MLAWDRGSNAILVLASLLGVALFFFAAALTANVLDRCARRRASSPSSSSSSSTTSLAAVPSKQQGNQSTGLASTMTMYDHGGHVTATASSTMNWFCSPAEFVDSPTVTACTTNCGACGGGAHRDGSSGGCCGKGAALSASPTSSTDLAGVPASGEKRYGTSAVAV